LGETAFTVSIDAKRNGVTTGISAHDRAQTIHTAADQRYGPEDFARPGQVFPLRSRDGGVLERRGHTEAAADLARLAGFPSLGVICEILNEDVTMARVPDLYPFCQSHRLELITIADLAKYRLDKAPEICAKTPNGNFDRQAEQRLADQTKAASWM
jgi:3,4-dihydroxy 2-butanone 4-phosphate synthase / GTP cyclohydrolase II